METLKALKSEGVNTCVETCGICADGAIELLLPYVDYRLFDIKLTDEKMHQCLLGAPLQRVMKSLSAITAANAHVTLRCPIIPGINDREEHFSAIRGIARNVRAAGIDIMPYHRLGRDKYLHLGKALPPCDIPAPDDDTVTGWERMVDINEID